MGIGKRLSTSTADLTSALPAGEAVRNDEEKTVLARTAPGQMLAIHTGMAALQIELQVLQDRLKRFDGGLVTRHIDPNSVRPTRWANRHEASFATPAFASLKESIALAGGNAQPILVREHLPDQYEIVFGHRRHRACLELGVPVLAAVAEQSLGDIEVFLSMERENRERADLSPYEQGQSYVSALDAGLFPSLRRLAEAVGCRRQSYWDFSGSANLGELANRLRESGRFIRREKSSVLPTLPAKQREEVAVEISNRPEYDLAKQDLATWLKTKDTHGGKRRSSKDEGEVAALRATAEWMGWSEDEAMEMGLDTADRAEALRRVGALRQLAGAGKITAAAEWIGHVVKDEKLVVFAYHVQVQKALVAALDEAGTVTPLEITGDMTAKARHAAIRAFQQDPNRRVIVCSLSAARTAITLTAAKRALIVELDWSPAGLEQAEDRVHRIGQAGQVTITYLHATDTLDDRMLSILDRKRAVIGKIAAGDAPFGYKPDGTPRLRPAGPGRRPLDATTRAERRKASKAKWQAANPERTRSYMRDRRLAIRVKAAKHDINDHDELLNLGYERMRHEMGDITYTREHHDAALHQAAVKADVARLFLASVGHVDRESDADQAVRGGRDSHAS